MKKFLSEHVRLHNTWQKRKQIEAILFFKIWKDKPVNTPDSIFVEMEVCFNKNSGTFYILQNGKHRTQIWAMLILLPRTQFIADRENKQTMC